MTTDLDLVAQWIDSNRERLATAQEHGSETTPYHDPPTNQLTKQSSSVQPF